MGFPLKKAIHGAAVFIIVLLGGLLALGVHQHRLHKHHEEIIAHSEKLLSHFAVIRDNVSESLLEGYLERLPRMAPEVELLQVEISKALENDFIPDEYKLALANQVDLPTIAFLLRNVGVDADPGMSRRLNQEIRLLGERLLLFNRTLGNHAKQRISGFQNVIIGALALVISLVVTILVLGHRQVATPLLALAGEVKDVSRGRRSELSRGLRQNPGEIAELATAFHNLYLTQVQSIEQMNRHNRILYAVHQAGRAVRKADSKEGLFKEVSRALLFNEDYCLVWIGEADATLQDFDRVLVESSGLLEEKEREECLALLLTEATDREGKLDATVRALREGQPVVELDILAGIPKSHLRDTQLAAGMVNRVSLPVIWENHTYGVMSIYSGQPQSFSEEEMKLLAKMATDVAFALYYLKARQELQWEKRLNIRLLELTGVMVVRLEQTGVVAGANGATESALGLSARDLAGRKWTDFLHSPLLGQGLDLGAGPADQIQETVLIARKGRKVPCRWRLLPRENNENIWLGMVVSGKWRHDGTAEKPAGREELEELFADIAHEINNTSNGIINYAQLLSDDLIDSIKLEHNLALTKIIKEGERIAALVGPLIGLEEKPDPVAVAGKKG